MSLWRFQRGRDNSQLIQAETVESHVHYHTGLQKSEVESICTSLVRAEFAMYSAHAQALIESRVSEFIENYLYEQTARSPESLASLMRPSMQRAIRSAQIEFATSGDTELGSVLVDLLVDLSSEEDRTTKSISLTDAISVAPKLTQGQLNSLSVILVLKLTNFNQWSSLPDMYSAFRTHLVPLVGVLADGGLPYRHMQGVGAGWISLGSTESLENLILKKYPGFFTHGLPISELPEEFPGGVDLLVPALRDSNAKQLKIFSASALNILAAPGTKLHPHLEVLQAVQRMRLYSPEEVQQDLVAHLPELKKLFEVWSSSNIGDFDLTTVGIALGHANWRARTDSALPFDVYVPSTV
jgi:hypothetical protein